MNVLWSHLLFPVVAGAISALTVPVSFWETSKAPLLTALSVIAAAVLVRLARGLPFTNADHFDLNEIRQVTAAIKQSARALRALIVVIFFSIGAVIVAAPAATRLTRWMVESPNYAAYVAPTVSAIVAFLLIYVFVRTIAVIQGDVSLIDLQSKLLISAVAKKQGDRFEKAQANMSTKMENPPGYGKILQ